MGARNIRRIAGLFVVVLFLTGLTILTGCKESEQEQAAAGDEAGQAPVEGIEPEELVAAASREIPQKTCPGMEGAINEDIYVEYKGKKVYFCCQGCAEAFKKDPEKYLAKLPQFKD